jgi:peroxiredoxin family protein
MRIELFKLVGETVSSIDDGEKLYKLLHPELKKGDSVDLDFGGVKQIFTPFLNSSFGRLLDHFEKETLMEKINLCHIDEAHLRRVNEFIDRKEQMNTDVAAREMMQDMFGEDELSESGQ